MLGKSTMVGALAFCGFALAQEAGNRVFFRAEVGPVPHAQATDVMVMTFGEKAVTGRPYSAEGVTEFTQKLSDGTTIARKNTSKVFRDSQGRMRREQTIGVIGPWVSDGEPPMTVTIFDPVSGESIVLNPKDKTARRVKLPPPPPAGPGADPKRIEFRKEVQVRVEGSGPGPGGEVMMPPIDAGRFDVLVHHGPGEAKTEKLGTQSFEAGVVAEGTRTTNTIPAGAIGNDRPITTVSTRWFSPDLQILVLNETDDPLAGKTVYRLTNIRQEEPSATLFQIPPDYTVKDTGDLRQRVIMHRESR